MSSGDRAFDHVLIVMFENQFRSYVLDNPYMASLAESGIDLANYFGVMHPSQTNYIASIAGELCDVTDDDRPTPPLEQRTIVDLVEDAGLSWKAYMDAYVPEATPWSEDLVPQDAYPYVLKHNPFSSFRRILERRDRWERVVGEDQLWRDLVAGTLPEYAWFTPDMWNDGHYLVGTHEESKPRAPGLVDQAASWLKGFFGRMRFPGPNSLLPPRTLVVVTFDEADFEASFDAHRKYTYDGPNQIYTVLLGDHLEPGVESEGYNHYSLLRTIEENFGLGTLEKNDAGANRFRFLWGESFAWGEPADAPISPSGPIAAAGLEDTLHVVFECTEGGLRHFTWDGRTWSDEEPVGVEGSEEIALVAAGSGLTLFVRGEGEGIDALEWTPSTGWSSVESLTDDGARALIAAGFGDGEVMLVWALADGSMTSRRRAGDEWAEAVAIGDHRTAGAIGLATLGSALYLVFQVDGSGLDVVSYNTADYNVVSVPEGAYGGAYDDTTKDLWSPSSFPVAHFSHGPASGQQHEGDLRRPYRGSAPLSATTLSGVIHLVHADQAGSSLVTETFSLSGVLTPALPVSYASADATTTSNGYGTLAQAGWTRQLPLTRAGEPPSALALATVGGTAVLLAAGETGTPMRMMVGSYE